MALHEYLVQEVALDCADGLLTRREAMRRLGLLGLTAGAAAALLAACGGDNSGSASSSSAAATTSGATASGASTTGAATTASGASPSAAPTTAPAGGTTAAPATTVAEARPLADLVQFTGPNGQLTAAYAAASGSPKGAVLVIHENTGLSPFIRSVPPRFAADGYNSLAVDLLSEEGGTAKMPTPGDATAALGKIPAERMIADLRAGLDELGRRTPGKKLAVVGFCFGGGLTWQLLAAGEPRVAAAVPFYGPAPASPNFTGSKQAAVLAIYAGNDTRVTSGQDTIKPALDAAGITYEVKVYPGVDHAFFNDTGARYNADASNQAYATVLEWFGQHLD